MGKIYYVMGKSASGKDTIYKRLVKELPELGTVRMYTTRPIRDGETNGVEYIFTDEKQLQTMKDAGKVIECRTYDTIYGPWSYFTADDGQIDLGSGSYLMMGTLESYEKLCSYYGAEVMVPLYIHVEDGERLQRALNREKTQKVPKYAEMCRRFLADEKDFAKERLDQCGIRKQYENTGLEPCIEEIIKDILCNEGKEKQMLKKIGFIGVGIMGKSMAFTWQQETVLPPFKDGANRTLTGGCAVTFQTDKILFMGGVNYDCFLAAIARPIHLAKAEAAQDSAAITRLQAEAKAYMHHPVEWYRFNTTLLQYDLSTKAWSDLGEYEQLARAGAGAVIQDGRLTIINGELKPGIRTPQVNQAKL